MVEPDRDSRRGSIAVLALGGFVSATSMRVAEPLLTDVATEFSVSAIDAAVVITGFMLAYGAFQLVHGPLADRVGKLNVACAALFLAALASLGCAFSNSLTELTVYRFLVGMTSGAVIPLSIAYVGDSVSFERRQQVMARFISGVILGGLVGPLIAGACSEFLNWRASFVFTAIGFALVGLLLAPRLGSDTRSTRADNDTLANLKAVLRLPAVHVICAVVAIEGFLYYGMFAYLGAYYRDEVGFSPFAVGVVLAASAVGGLLYSATVQLWVKHVGVVRMVICAGALLLITFMTLSTFSIWALSIMHLLVLGLGLNLMHNTLQTQASEMAPFARGTAIAVFALSLFLGQATGVYVNGKTIEAFGFQPVMMATGALLFGLALFLARWLQGRTS